MALIPGKALTLIFHVTNQSKCRRVYNVQGLRYSTIYLMASSDVINFRIGSKKVSSSWFILFPK
jgi:hypothetical protein